MKNNYTPLAFPILSSPIVPVCRVAEIHLRDAEDLLRALDARAPDLSEPVLEGGPISFRPTNISVEVYMIRVYTLKVGS